MVAGKAIRDLRCTVDFGNAQIDIDYGALTDPLALHYNLGGLKLGAPPGEAMAISYGWMGPRISNMPVASARETPTAEQREILRLR